jgi:uncharacterized protein YecT (DUF1311 family)
MDWSNLRAFTLTFCLVFSTFVTAPRAAEKGEDECLRLHPKITSPVEMVTCTSDVEGSRKRLNTAYGALAKTLNPDWLALLEKAQRAWLAFRKSECEYDTAGYPGNTMYSSGVIFCTANMNRARAAKFEAEAKDSVQ